MKISKKQLASILRESADVSDILSIIGDVADASYLQKRAVELVREGMNTGKVDQKNLKQAISYLALARMLATPAKKSKVKKEIQDTLSKAILGKTTEEPK